MVFANSDVSTHSRPKAAGLRQPCTERNARAFQHTAARRRLGTKCRQLLVHRMFQHTAARRRLGFVTKSRKLLHWFQHTAARRRLAALYSVQTGYVRVSTHSRPKAAGFASMQLLLFRQGFNTQPPEGGWLPVPDLCPVRHRFNTQPPEGGWGRVLLIWGGCPRFNTQPPEGGCLLCSRCRSHISVSTRSRPKAAGYSCY